jgi:hypothetical protein
MSEEKGTPYFQQLESQFRQYIENRVLLLKMQAAGKSAKISAALVVFLLLAMVGFFLLFFISIMAGYLFAELTGSLFYGFGIITGLYLLFFIILILLRKKYIEPFIANTVVKVIFEKEEESDFEKHNYVNTADEKVHTNDRPTEGGGKGVAENSERAGGSASKSN